MKKNNVIDHTKCLDKVRKQIMQGTDLKYVRFDMSTVKSYGDNNERSQFYKTGQRITIGFDKKRRDGTVVLKEEKSFVAHDYCPFCGKKFTD